MSDDDSALQQVGGQAEQTVDCGDSNGGGHEHPPTEMPQPDESHKEAAREMMRTTYQERPTVVLPGSGGTVSGTAINDWLDDDGNSKYADDEDAPAAQAESNDQLHDDGLDEDQIAKDKAFNDRARNDRANWDEAAADEEAAGE